MQGWLDKRHPAANGKWDKKYCVFADGKVLIFSDEDRTQPNGSSVKIEPTTRVVAFTKESAPGDSVQYRTERPFGFAIDANPAAGEESRITYFDAGSQESLDAWLATLSQKTPGAPYAPSAAPSAPASVACPALQIFTGAVQPAPGGGNMVDVMLRIQTPLEGRRVPIDIVCVLDISGSMGTQASIVGQESNGLSLLDVAKHGVKTVLNTLGSDDRLAVVLFDHQSEILFDLTAMDEAGRTSCQEKLDGVCPRGATNIWLGLEAGLNACQNGQDAAAKRLSHIILLTDGQTQERNTVIPRIDEYRAKHERLPCTISTFGFGYNIDSPLLVDMALKGSGTYSFIPDAGFVGTVFVNTVSNILVTMAQEVFLALDLEEGVEINKVFGNYTHTKTSSGSRIALGTLQIGQVRDIALKMSVAKPGGDFLGGNVTYELPGSDRQMTDLVEASLPGKPDEAKEVKLVVNRLCFAEALQKAADPDVKLEEKQVLMKNLSEQLRVSEVQGEYMQDLRADVEGQASEAISKQEYFQKWGRHYLPSLMFAHRSQVCNNFKDPGVQHYGGNLFKELQDMADATFNTLDPPKPSVRRSSSYGGGNSSAVSAAPVSMAAYNDRCAG